MDASNIINNADDISLSSAAGGHNFCDLWPGGRQALQALQEIIKNPVAKGAVGIVIAAGDAVSKKKCG
jgi:hypothetical protein